MTRWPLNDGPDMGRRRFLREDRGGRRNAHEQNQNRTGQAGHIDLEDYGEGWQTPVARA